MFELYVHFLQNSDLLFPSPVFDNLAGSILVIRIHSMLGLRGAESGVHRPDCRVYGVEDRHLRVAPPP